MSVRLSTYLWPLAVVGLAFACKPPEATYDIAPVLLNREEVARALDNARTTEDAVVVLLVRVDEGGSVTDVRVAVGSGDRRLDNWAVYAGRQMRFEPAMKSGRPIPSLVRIPVTFEQAPPPSEPPAVLNADSVATLLTREHGEVRGAAHLRVHVSAEGQIFELMHLRATSLDVRERARDLVAHLRFRAARDQDEPVEAWIVVRVEFADVESQICIEPDLEAVGVGAVRTGTITCFGPGLPMRRSPE